MKILITGTPGTGKSTVINELRRRGYAAFDTDDEPGVTRLQRIGGGEFVEWPKGFVDWTKHEWNWQETELKQLLGTAEDVFVGAIVSNQKTFYHLFDKIFVLTIGDRQLRHRLTTRTNHDYNNDPANIARTVGKNQQYTAEFLAAGAMPIVNDQPAAATVDAMLHALHLPLTKHVGEKRR